MPLIDILILFLIGSCFGSFSSVLIERWHSKKGGILLGRSECPHCSHQLTAIELIPIVSYIAQGAQCKNCKTSISILYPLLEIYMGIVFVLSGWIALSFGYSYIDSMWWIFLFWSFITAVYMIYDFRYMEIPDQVLIPGIYLTLTVLIAGVFIPNFQVFFDIPTYNTFHTLDTSAFFMMLQDHILGAWLLYTFFYLQILIPGSIFLWKNKRSKEILTLCSTYFLFPFLLFTQIFEKNTEGTDSQTEEEIPTWIGGGDLRIAIFIGLTLGTVHGIASLFFAYILGSLYGCIALSWQKINTKKQKISHQIPFGPFLGIGWFLSLIFYFQILGYVTGV